jgi:ribosomal protein S18 acetylase RimI-like enzyme
MDGVRVGGAVVILDAHDVMQLGGEPELALLWDLRVAPAARRRGVARALLAEVEAIARAAAVRGVVAETQDVNIPACQLYAGAGYVVSAVDANAYPDLPGETRVMWTKRF